MSRYNLRSRTNINYNEDHYFNNIGIADDYHFNNDVQIVGFVDIKVNNVVDNTVIIKKLTDLIKTKLNDIYNAKGIQNKKKHIWILFPLAIQLLKYNTNNRYNKFELVVINKINEFLYDDKNFNNKEKKKLLKYINNKYKICLNIITHF
jgi:hypothetical protein